MAPIKGYIVYPTYRIIENKANVYLFGKLSTGESFLAICPFQPYFYIKKDDLKKAEKIKEFSKFKNEETDFKNFDSEEMIKVMVNIPADVSHLRDCLHAEKIQCYEADIRFVVRFLIDHGIRGSLIIEGEYKKGDYVDRIYENPKLKPMDMEDYFPKLKVLSLDIETPRDSGKIFCVSLYSEDFKKVLFVGNSKTETEKLEHGIVCKDEKELLEKLHEHIKKIDPDVIAGWNIVDFDLNVIRERLKYHKMDMRFGRADWDCHITVRESFFMTSRAEFPGRMVLDGIDLLKGAFIKLDNYKLNTAARVILNKEKLITGENKAAEIERLYKEDPQKLIDYNLMDSELVYDIIMKSNTLALAIERSMLTGMTLDRVNASIASLDFVYLSEAKKRKLVTATTGYSEKNERIKGGFVRKSKPGIYKYILVFDFKSLYPSIIRTFNIDPYSFAGKKEKALKEYKKDDLIEAPNGAMFRKKDAILPDLIQKLWAKRDKAKKEKNKLASHAIKILMNSFFGVLANPTCRFYNLDIANAITNFGQTIIKLIAEKIEEMDYGVIYGDTDSIFVESRAKSYEEAEKIGNKLQRFANEFFEEHVKKSYSVQNFLELQFEKIYIKFLMPKIRGSELGAKKRYAGLLKKDGKEALDFVGMEFVRRDWTELAKKFQGELLKRVFEEKDPSDYVKKLIEDIKAGKCDDLLVYRKGLSKEIKEYTKITPPHVKAARMLDHIDSDVIEYYITVDGPQPLQKLKSRIDYDHYIDKQIRPLADSILCFYGTDFDNLVKGKQKSLFDFEGK